MQVYAHQQHKMCTTSIDYLMVKLTILGNHKESTYSKNRYKPHRTQNIKILERKK